MRDTRIDDLIDYVAPARATRWLLWGLVGFTLLAIGWAAVAQIDRTVRGTGRVVPRAQLQTLSSLEGGVIAQILIRSGQLVRAGQPLIQLDPTERSAELGSGAATQGALRARIARLSAEVAGRAPSFPADPAEDYVRQVAIERQLHAARIADLSSAMAVARARVVQSDRAVIEAQAARAAALATREGARTELDILRPLVERGLEPRLALIQAEARASTAAAQLAAADAAIARAQAAVAQAQAEQVRVQGDWRMAAADALAVAQADLSAQQRSLPALQRRVERTVVRAPLDGRVNRVLVTTRGSAVGPGAPLLELVPSGGGLLVEARIAAQDIGRVRIDQPARVALTAYDQAVHGTLDGRVVTISPDSLTDERTGEIYYLVRVQTRSETLASATGQSLPVGPGMVAEVSLLGERRSVLSYLLTPITRLSDRALRE